MDGATRYLIAVPQALAAAARAAAATWDPAGAETMFRNPTLHDQAGTPYVFSYGWIADAHAPDIQAALSVHFPGGVMVAACPFDAALVQADLTRVAVNILPG